MKAVQLFRLTAAFLFCSVIAFSQLTQDRIDKFFIDFNNEKTKISDLFSDSFIKKVPEDKIIQIRNDFLQKFGSYQNAALSGGNQIEITYLKCKMPGRIGFDSAGKVSTLWFGVPSYISDNLDSIKNELSNINADISVCIKRDNNIVFDYQKDEPLAVGSSFKLFVLKSLLKAIGEGTINWKDSLDVKDENKSLPSGILQGSPDGYKISIRKVANLMISISDNTATDMLINKLTRERIETESPKTLIPFYKTRELFILKLATDSSDVIKFINGDIEFKRKILTELNDVELPKIDANSFIKPTYLEIEWYVSTLELCNAIESLYGEEALSLNPGFLDKKKWSYIGYKGGSEPGVLNFTYLLKKEKDSPLMSVSATINDNKNIVEINEAFTTLVNRLIDHFWKN